MNQQVTQAIVLSRTDFGEADRILTVLTAQYGKLRLMAKGVRRVKSKLAGGIELFSVSDITFIKGKSDIATLVSTRLRTHYAHIVADLERTMLGYELIKRLNKITEDEVEPAYFELLEHAFIALNQPKIPTALIELWFGTQLLQLGGHMPNLQTDETGKRLEETASYTFDFERVSFAISPHGRYKAADIKFLRLLFSGHRPEMLAQVQGSTALVPHLSPLVGTMLRDHLRV
ncbi:MAG TPA: DNA repair protein RecO [Candidatus Saccharimonadales bacterium]|nr:DNA repair protein RecO [Candidatus Saccharimonadales bacterium]